jgi:hypothetical protein
MRETRRRPGGVMARLLDPTVVILGACLLAAGCGPAASGGGTVTPGGNGKVRDGAEPEGDEEGNDVGSLRDRLERLSREQDAKASGSDGSFGACEDLCSLASSICTVKEKLCEVADRHPGEEEYQSLCRKAELECSEAEDSCVACVETRESREEAAASKPPAK